jgi:hypothetical protein
MNDKYNTYFRFHRPNQAPSRHSHQQAVVSASQAEIVSSYCYKGSKVYVEGKLQTDQYEKNGETRYSTKIVVDEFKGTVHIFLIFKIFYWFTITICMLMHIFLLFFIFNFLNYSPV